jgi:hypothetical protein
MCSSDRLCNRVAHEYAKQLSPEDRVEEWHVTSPATKKTVIGLPNHRTEGCQVMCMNFTVTRGTGRSRGSWSCSYRLQVVLSIFLIIVHDHELFCTCCFVYFLDMLQQLFSSAAPAFQTAAYGVGDRYRVWHLFEVCLEHGREQV